MIYDIILHGMVTFLLIDSFGIEQSSVWWWVLAVLINVVLTATKSIN